MDCLGGVLEASWGHLGGVLGRLGVVLARFGGVWRHLRASGGASWGRSESFLGRLVSVLEASWSVLAANFSHAILDAIFELDFCVFLLPKIKLRIVENH